MYIITLDTGTTNTRVTLWKNEEVVDKVSCEVGVRNTAIDGNNSELKCAIREAINEILYKNGVSLNEIDKILASGMITSNVGLVEVPHLLAPVGIEDFANGMVSYSIPDVVDKEIWFIPGVKNNVMNISLENCEAMDIMRGEEVETIALQERMRLEGAALIILPGSHSKFISVNNEGKITGCLTSVAGELISVITHNTIITNALENSLASEFDEKMIIEGYKNGKKSGLNRSIFSVRIIDQFIDYSVNEKANFLLGAVLSTDLQAIKNSSALKVSEESNVIIGGKNILKDSFECILKEESYFSSIKAVSSNHMADLAGFGSICVAKKRGLL